MVTRSPGAPVFRPGDRVRVSWSGLVSDAIVVDVYDSVVGRRVVVDLLTNDDEGVLPRHRLAVPLDRLSLLAA